MVKTENGDKIEFAGILMEEYARRTGLTDVGGEVTRRYLWTDAFAVQAFLSLENVTNVTSWGDLAVKLIDEVHHTLGRYRQDDEREGWISGLTGEEGMEHPTAGGLRIGKRLPERKEGERLDHRLEWERDGQYYHYITRWINALLQAGQAKGRERYLRYAAELALVTTKFVYRSGSARRMYWKISTDLSRPLVESMGAHDPLEGLILAYYCSELYPGAKDELEAVIEDLEFICHGKDWATSDPLGIGGLLLNCCRSFQLSEKMDLPESVAPEKLLADCMDSLEAFRRFQNLSGAAAGRLAFRECGLSLGLRVVPIIEFLAESPALDTSLLRRYLYLADEIERFWCEDGNRRAQSWTDHLDINSVMLASSLVANESPAGFV